MPVALPDLFKPIENCAHVALAVSGGADSVALMHLAASWSADLGGSPRLAVLTVDHGLRPGSADEAQQVNDWAARLGLAHVTLEWTGPKPVAGVQARAREARYDLMATWCRVQGADALLTAHTLDDQAETVLMRLTRTSSIDSIAGIPPVGAWQGVPVIRPLLGVTRAVLRSELAARGQPWIDDPSNADDRFERVRVRRALAVLADEGVTAAQLAGLAGRCREASDALDRLAREFIAREVRISAHGHGEMTAEAFLGEQGLVRLRVLRKLLPLFGGGKPVLKAELERLAAALAAPGTRRTLGGAVIWRRKDRVLVAREAGRIAAGPVAIPEVGSIIWDGRFMVTAPAGCQVVSGLSAPPQPRIEDIPRLVQDAQPVVLDPAGQPVSVDFTGAGPVSARFLHLKPP